MQEQIKRQPEAHENYIKIRPHHGLCSEFFQGKGYSSEFVSNMSIVLSELNAGDPFIRLTVGTDSICFGCPHSGDRCETEDKVSRYDNAVLKLCGLSEGNILRWGEFRVTVREKILSPGLLSQVCGDCMWSGICFQDKTR